MCRAEPWPSLSRHPASCWGTEWLLRVTQWWTGEGSCHSESPPLPRHRLLSCSLQPVCVPTPSGKVLSLSLFHNLGPAAQWGPSPSEGGCAQGSGVGGKASGEVALSLRKCNHLRALPPLGPKQEGGGASEEAAWEVTGTLGLSQTKAGERNGALAPQPKVPLLSAHSVLLSPLLQPLLLAALQRVSLSLASSSPRSPFPSLPLWAPSLQDPLPTGSSPCSRDVPGILPGLLLNAPLPPPPPSPVPPQASLWV